MTNQQNQLKALTAELEASRMCEAELSAMLSNTISLLTAHNRVIAAAQHANRVKAETLNKQIQLTQSQRYPNTQHHHA